MAVQSTISVWPPGMEPLGHPSPGADADASPRARGARAIIGRSRPRRSATTLPREAWREVSWREGSNQTLTSRFAAVRIRPATRDGKLTAPQPLEWLLIERPEGDSPLTVSLSAIPPGPPTARNISPIPAFQTPRRRRSDPNDTSKTRSPASDDSAQSPWPETSCAARVAKPCDHNRPIEGQRDAVELTLRQDPAGTSTAGNRAQGSSRPARRFHARTRLRARPLLSARAKLGRSLPEWRSYPPR